MAQPQPTVTSTYAGEFAGEYISAALFSGVTLDSNAITIKPNVKFKEVIKSFSKGSSIVDSTCEFTDTADITLTEVILEPKAFQQNLIVCKEQFRNDWEAVQMGYSAFDNLPPKFSDFLIAYASAEVAEFMETKIWTGAAGANSFAGFKALSLAAPAGNKVAGIAITAANVVTEMTKVTDAIPTAVYGKEDLFLYISQNVARHYITALGGFGAAGLGAAGSNNEGSQWYQGGNLSINGVKIFVTNGQGANDMFAARKSNLMFGTGLLNDTNTVKVIDMADIDGSEQVRMVMRFTGGVQIGVLSEIVRYA